MKLLISLATRNRPQKLLSTIRQSIANWTHPNTEMILQVDADDYATLGILTETKLDPRVKVNINKREDTIAEKWNRAMKEPADVYMIGGDDDPVVTQGYDSKILDAEQLFPDGIGMVYGHMSNASFSSIMCPTRKWVEKLGYILPEYFPYWFCDHWIDDIGHMTGRIVHADVRSDQRKVGQTQEMREPAWWATWFDAAVMLRRQEAIGVIDHLGEDALHKARLQTNYLRVEYRSKWINDNVRAQARGLEAMASANSLKDERYLRVKEKAVALIPKMLEGMEPQQAKVFHDLLVVPDKILSFPRAFG
jgi:glycosyltransferase involved in cell wall biosynthesis